MKKIFILIAFLLVSSALSQTYIRGNGSVFCGKISNSYGFSGTSAPWKLVVDTVYVDTTGTGTYKKIGLGVAGSGDTSKAVALHVQTSGPQGFFSFIGARTAAGDSGVFIVKPLCYSRTTSSWVSSHNMACNGLNKCDTTLTTALDSAGFGIEEYFPSYCDSMKVVITVKGATGASRLSSTPTLVRSLGLCAY